MPDPAVSVEVQRGRALVQPMCNDMVDGTVWRVDQRLTAVAGSGRIRLDPPDGIGSSSCGASGSLRLDDLLAEDDTRFVAVEIETDEIGCYVG